MSTRPDWKEKVHPLFIESSAVYRRAIKQWLALGPRPPAEEVARIHRLFRQEMEAVRVRYAQAQYTPTASDPLDIILVDTERSAWPPTELEMEQGFLELLYWRRFKEPLSVAWQEANHGDLDALQRIHRIEEDYARLRFGKGPIKEAKGNSEHALLFEIGLDLGLSILSPEELADCFETVCPCGQFHDADALKKQRSRKERAIRKATNWFAAQYAKVPTREWMAAYGRDGLCAKGARQWDRLRAGFTWARSANQHSAT